MCGISTNNHNSEMRLLRLCIEILVLAAIFSLCACSKTVHWEEEVPLNTGETIWVTKTLNYTLKGGAGNPLDLAYRPNWVEKLTFTWGGKEYAYVGDARIILLAISKQKVPVLVARAADSGWHHAHNYKCTTPFYVQFVPDASGRNWTWPPSIESWLYGLPHNLLRTREEPKKMKTRYTARERNDEDSWGSIQDPSKANIDPNHTVNTCFK
jgi:hypothetical protein